MNTNYAQAGAALGNPTGLGGQQLERPLDRIGIAADRLQKLNSIVYEFTSRFHGPTPPAAPSASVGCLAAEPNYGGGHQGNLARLFDQLNALEEQIHSLSAIG